MYAIRSYYEVRHRQVERSETRRRAAWALGEIEDRRAVQPLSRLVNDPDADVRRQAVWALGEIQDQSSQTGLAAALVV